MKITDQNEKIADSSMLKVKFSPTAVLEDVQPIRAAAFHPGGELIAIGSNSKTLRVCSCHMLSDSVQTLVRDDGYQDLPVLFKRNKHHRGSVYSVAWNPKGNLLATGSNDKSVIVVGFDADNCTSTGADREFSFHRGTVRDIHFQENNIMLSCGGGDNLLHVTDVEKGCEIGSYSGHTDTIHCVRSHRDMLITGSADATIRLWDKRSNTCTRVIGAAIGTQGMSSVTSLSLNNFGNLLCASREDGVCMLYDIEMGSLLAAFTPHTPVTCKSVEFYKNPRYVLSGSYDGTIALTCVEQVLLNPDLPCTEIIGTHRDKVTNTVWHPTKQAFATCSADRTVCLWTAKDSVTVE